MLDGNKPHSSTLENNRVRDIKTALNRDTQLSALRQGGFDLLIVGGGATGCGIALDAISRGLKVALIEKDDFASGTSSRSTKLLHGGVRYLERAVLDLDRGQYALVKEALQEREILLRLAPHLARYLPLLTPLYHRAEVPYYYAGLKMYDWLAGDDDAPPSRYVSAKEALEHCPMLQPNHLRGGVVYYDGQFDDARMNLSILLRATELGTVAANYVGVTSLEMQNGRITGAQVQDTLAGSRFSISAKIVINATGPHADSLRQMADPKIAHLLKASSGAHIVLDRRFSAPEMGLLIPKTEDGRVLFLLPWLGHTLVGTTDNPSKVVSNPEASQEDIAYILRQLQKYFSIQVSSQDVLAKWSGLRPLVQSAAAVSTAKLSREHVVEVLPSGLLTIAGGKWTTYRRMSIDAMDEAIQAANLKPTGPSRTHEIFLAGGAAYSLQLPDELHATYGRDLYTCRYLARAYGDRAARVLDIADKEVKGVLVEGHPYLEAEVLYAARFEAACRSMDVVARRLRLSFLDSRATNKALPRVQALLGKELGWNADEKQADSAQSRASGFAIT